MTEVDIDHLRSWIGKSRVVEDIATPRLALSLNAVLDRDERVGEGAPAPVGIHWCLAPDIVPMREIGPDGHPARGGFLPPVPFPRRMWAAGALQFHGDFRVGDRIARHSTIDNVEFKTGRSGEMIFVTVRHAYETPRGLALDERQDIVYRKLEGGSSAASAASPPPAEPEPADVTREVDANPVLLFRYSAITFNGHRIHYDHPYVTGEEGYPGLIFHGPLQATLLLSLATDLGEGKVPARFSFRAVRPLFAGGRPKLKARKEDKGLALWCEAPDARVTMTATAEG